MAQELDNQKTQATPPIVDPIGELPLRPLSAVGSIPPPQQAVAMAPPPQTIQNANQPQGQAVAIHAAGGYPGNAVGPATPAVHSPGIRDRIGDIIHAPGIRDRIGDIIHGSPAEQAGAKDWQTKMSELDAKIKNTRPDDPVFASLLQAKEILKGQQPHTPLANFAYNALDQVEGNFNPRGEQAVQMGQNERQQARERAVMMPSTLAKNAAETKEAEARASTPAKVTIDDLIGQRTAQLQAIGKNPATDSVIQQLNTEKQATQKVGGGAAAYSTTQLNNANQQLADLYRKLHPEMKPEEPIPTAYQVPQDGGQESFNNAKGMLDNLQALQARGDEAAFHKQEHEDQLKHIAAVEANTQAAQGKKDENVEITRREKVVTYYQAAGEATTRFNTMADNYAKANDAIKSGHKDQQAEVSLLMNHIGMTLGAQKGARITKDMIHEAEKSAPLGELLGQKFDKDGYLVGITLTPQQMTEMMQLARQKFADLIKKARNDSMFVTNDEKMAEGPKRSTNHSLQLYYLGLANGDKAAAQQMATDDGWSE